ncbi:MAG: hypothetical protein KDA87_27840, partial [Planctomycetales bacterium]|nr:hypothetical protein [Planctomycetales bacterium]
WVDTTEPNQPFLSVAQDTGMMDDDGVTNVNPPTFTIIANDTTDGGANAFPHDVKIRLYDRPGNADGETLIFSQDLTEAGSLTITLPEGLSEGIHNLKLEVEDRAGNISHPYLTTIRIDTTPPAQTPIDLLTSSDSGMMNDDNVTNKMQPAFSGVSTVGSKVFIFANGQIV